MRHDLNRPWLLPPSGTPNRVEGNPGAETLVEKWRDLVAARDALVARIEADAPRARPELVAFDRELASYPKKERFRCSRPRAAREARRRRDGLDKKTALACRGEKLAEVPCAGPTGCAKYQDHANCDTSVAVAGQPCMGEDDEYACSPDGKRAVVCKGGRFEPWLECRGKNGCSILGRTPSCDTTVAEKGDPCKELGKTACTVDQKQMVICRDGKFDFYRHCRGQYGCSLKLDTVSCDESISKDGDPCGQPGMVVCSEDGKTELVCQGGTYRKSLTCKTACTVTNRPGRPIDCQ